MFCFTLSQTTNFRLFQTKRVTDDNFKFEKKKDKKFVKQVEDTGGKGETACYEQFLLFPQCFQDLYCRLIKTRACLGKELKLRKLRNRTNKKNISKSNRMCSLVYLQ